MPKTLKFIREVRAPGPSNAICITVSVNLENEINPIDNDIPLSQIHQQATACGKELRQNMAKLIHARSVDSSRESLTYWDPRLWFGLSPSGLPERRIYASAIVDAPRLKEALKSLKEMGYEQLR